MKYLPQLDGLRTMAVMAVIGSHWLNPVLLAGKKIPLGVLGVTIFFTLSGYLITRIILNLKYQYETHSVTLTKSWQYFFIRRALRLFPAYYLTLVAAFTFLPSLTMREKMFHLFYGTNFLVFFDQRWPGPLSHFWSLGVEEQFYIFWFFLILLVPRKFLPQTIIGTFFLSFLFKAVGFHFGLKLHQLLTPGCMDAFALGAGVCFIGPVRNKKHNIMARTANYVAIVATIATIFLVNSGYYPLVLPACIALSTALYLYRIDQGCPTETEKFFSHPVMTATGRVSYGIYLFHNFIPLLYHAATHKLAIPVLQRSFIKLPIMLCLLLLAAFTSYYFFERYFLQLKDKFSTR